MTQWNVIINHDVILRVISGDREIPPPPFLSMMAKRNVALSALPTCPGVLGEGD